MNMLPDHIFAAAMQKIAYYPQPYQGGQMQSYDHAVKAQQNAQKQRDKQDIGRVAAGVGAAAHALKPFAASSVKNRGIASKMGRGLARGAAHVGDSALGAGRAALKKVKNLAVQPVGQRTGGGMMKKVHEARTKMHDTKGSDLGYTVTKGKTKNTKPTVTRTSAQQAAHDKLRAARKAFVQHGRAYQDQSVGHNAGKAKPKQFTDSSKFYGVKTNKERNKEVKKLQKPKNWKGRFEAAGGMHGMLSRAAKGAAGAKVVAKAITG